MKKQIKQIESESTRITWKGWLGEGKVNYDKESALGELINNILTKTGTRSKLYTAQVVFDTVTGKMWITDDFVGCPPEHLSALHDLGKSHTNGAILSEHGGGSKSAMCWWGTPIHIRSSVDGNDFYDKLPDYKSEWSMWYPPQKSEPIKRYNTSTQEWESQENTGLQIHIDMSKDQIPSRKVWFENLVNSLGAKYFEYLNKTLKIEIVWLKAGEYIESWWVTPIKPLLSANPNTGKKTIGVNNQLGANNWDLERVWKCPTTGIILDLKIGWAAHPDNVKAHFEATKDELYNLEDYENNPYRYNGPAVGLHYSKKGVPISGGGFKASSRGESLIGFLDIIDGVSTVKTKNGIVRSTDVIEMEENLSEYLHKEGFRVRSRDKYFKMSETEMENNLLEKLRTSVKLRKYLQVDECSGFNNQWNAHSGIPDIVGLDSSKNVKFVLELKKEGGKDLWKAVFQGLTYATECDSKKIIIVAQDPDLQSDIESKLDIWRQNGYDISYEQYQHLMENF
jgi:hypothetical protein